MTEQYSIESSPTLIGLRKLCSSATICVDNSITLGTYLQLAEAQEGELRVAKNDLNRQYILLRVHVTLLIAVCQHNGATAPSHAKTRLEVRRKIQQGLETLEEIALQIVKKDDEERSLNEQLFELFDCDGVGPKDKLDLDVEQCIELLTMSAEGGKPPPLPPIPLPLPTPPPPSAVSFDILRIPFPVADSVNAVLTKPPPSAPPPPLPPTTHESRSGVLPLPSISSMEVGILKKIASACGFFDFAAQAAQLQSLPPPLTMYFELKMNSGSRWLFYKDDYAVSYIPFLRFLSPDFQVSREANETNRCFFIHLGMAVKIHPFALQSAMRVMAQQLLSSLEGSPAESLTAALTDIVPSINEYAGFVDANALCFLWPEEFRTKRICIISNTHTLQPMFSSFSARGVASEQIDAEIVIHSDGQHFTLLRPLQGARSFLSSVLKDARSAQCVIQSFECDNELTSAGNTGGGSIRRVLERVLMS